MAAAGTVDAMATAATADVAATDIAPDTPVAEPTAAELDGPDTQPEHAVQLAHLAPQPAEHAADIAAAALAVDSVVAAAMPAAAATVVVAVTGKSH